jgi:aminomethyltransferase
LSWSIGKRRRADGGFPGFERIARELKDGPSRKRVGLLLDGRQPAREGSEITDESGAIIGKITSGGFAPSLERSIAMGYVDGSHAAVGAKLNALVRGKPLAASVVAFPFFPHRYVR